HPAPMSGDGNEFGLGNIHNLYLQQAAERGLAGLAALLALLGTMLYAGIVWLRRKLDGDTLWFAAALPAFLVMNLTETSFQHALPAFSVFFAFGAARAAAADRNVIIDNSTAGSRG
ncbi:MAG TPA: hypothetical protein PLL10_04305, partial [Elusimicrobiales bacterium]|nr:hypothetical protein [Elusimicrobiales bacterium]